MPRIARVSLALLGMGVLCLSASIGCGQGEVNYPYSDVNTEIRPSIWCSIEPNPVLINSSYIIRGGDLPKRGTLRVVVSDSNGSANIDANTDKAGRLEIQLLAEQAGSATVEIYKLGKRKDILLTRCAFEVIQPNQCGNGLCEPVEDCQSCSADCGTCPPICGDGDCQAEEDCSNCPQDCGECLPICGDENCDVDENCENCPDDCGICPPECGDEVCEGDENCGNCPQDCGECTPECGDGECQRPDENCDNCPQDCGECPTTGGELQFKSGFEPNTYLTSSTIKGTDNSAPLGINDWDSLSDYLPWAKYSSFYLEGGSMNITEDPTGADNLVLHFHNTEIVNGHSRTQWTLKQVSGWSDDGQQNLFDQQFYRYRMYIPEEISTLFSYSEWARWYMIWESHTWESENTRHGVYIRKDTNSNHWYFRVLQESPEGCHGNPSNCDYYWENNGAWAPTYNGQNVAVPFGQWFTFEVFFKYHELNGEFYVAVTRENNPRQIVAHFIGQTQYGTKLRDQMVFKFYHDSEYINRLPNGTHQYYDDFEIWSDYPPGY